MEYKHATQSVEEDSKSYEKDDGHHARPISIEGAEEVLTEYEKKIVTIKNKLGFHARPITMFIQLAAKYDKRVCIGYNKNIIEGIPINKKVYVQTNSIMGLLKLGAKKGSKIEIIVEKGENSKEVMESLVNLVESGFEED